MNVFVEDMVRTGALAQAAPIPAPRASSQGLRRFRRFAWRLAASDVTSIMGALVTAYMVRFGVRPMPPPYLLLVAVTPVVWLVTFRSFGLYAPQRLSALEEASRVLSAVGVAMALVTVMSFWTDASFSRVVVGLTTVFALAAEFGFRGSWRRYLRLERRAGRMTLRTLIVGANDEALAAYESMGDTSLGYEPVGIVGSPGASAAAKGIPWYGEISELPRVAAQLNAECFFLATTAVSSQDVVDAVKLARRNRLEVRISTAVPDLLTTRVTVHSFGDTMAMSIRTPALRGAQAPVKRVVDVFLSGLVLVLSAPVMAAVAIAIKIESRGPVLFKQSRVTRAGETFSMLKFRTMRADGDAVLERLGIDKSVAFFKLGEDDPRLTRVGRFLRKYSLDELPQLVNILRGDMSLVGPRPLPADQVTSNLRMLGPRHEVAAGLTGWWQVQGRSDITDPEEAVELDHFYIENWSLGLDAYILMKTIGAVLRKSGAR